MNRKAEMGTSTVILIVIGVIALVVVAFLILNSSKGGKETAFSCELAGGDCYRDNCPVGTSSYALGDGWCNDQNPQKGNKCCI